MKCTAGKSHNKQKNRRNHRLYKYAPALTKKNFQGQIIKYVTLLCVKNRRYVVSGQSVKSNGGHMLMIRAAWTIRRPEMA